MGLAKKYFPYDHLDNRLDDHLEMPLTEVIDKISPKDGMWDGSLEHYFSVGFSAMRCVKAAMHAARLNDFTSILDFPSGYGRVLRMMKAYFPNARLAACDIDRHAVDFCARTFDAIPLYSERNPKDVKINDHFDLIWVGSLLTHLDDYRWDGFLKLFVSLLNPNGLLVVTSHGRRSAERIREWIRTRKGTSVMSSEQLYGLDAGRCKELLTAYDTRGFGYVAYHSEEDYGTALASPSWVLSYLHKFIDLRLVSYIEYGWDNHHDVIAFKKMKPSEFVARDRFENLPLLDSGELSRPGSTDSQGYGKSIEEMQSRIRELLEWNQTLKTALDVKDKQIRDLLEWDQKLKAELNEIDGLKAEITVIRRSFGYRFMKFYASRIDRLFPDGTSRGKLRRRITNSLSHH